MKTDSKEYARLDLQAALDAQKSALDRNRLGQFATPTPLALDILAHAKKLLPRNKPVRFLDPAIGTGAFYSALLAVFGEKRVDAATGFEIDPHYGKPAQALWSKSGVDYRLADFTRANPPNRAEGLYDLLICNPPYVRHHHLAVDEKPRLQELSEKACGVRVGGLAGLYCYFLALSHAWMREGSVAGWLIPSEFMDVNYGRAVKDYLLHKVNLLHIHRFDPKDVQFGDALVSSAVVWFRKETPPKEHRVLMTFGGSLLNPRESETVDASALYRRHKWTRTQAESDKSLLESPRLGDFFSIKRGIATGDNSFFILDRKSIEERDLPIELFRPILPSPRYLTQEEILSDKTGKPLLDRELYLLDCRLQEEEVRRKFPSLWAYLQSGKPSVADRYLCRSRNPWYSQETRPAAPFLCTYMGRGRGEDKKPFRFLFNRSSATAANVYLMLYPKEPLARAMNATPSVAREVWKFLNRITPEDMLSEGRVYGGGLYKMEPKELANVQAGILKSLVGEATSKPRQREFGDLLELRVA